MNPVPPPQLEPPTPNRLRSGVSGVLLAAWPMFTVLAITIVSFALIQYFNVQLGNLQAQDIEAPALPTEVPFDEPLLPPAEDLTVRIGVFAESYGLREQFLAPLYSAARSAEAEDIQQAAVALILGHELGRSEGVESRISRLSESEDERLNQIAQVYADGTSDEERITLANTFDDESQFMFQLAGVHARELAGTDSGREELTSLAGVLPALLAFGAMAVVVGIGAVALLLGIIFMSTGKWPAQGFPVQARSIEDGRRLGLRMVIYLFVYMSVSQTLALLLSRVLPAIFAVGISWLLTLALLSVLYKLPIGGISDSFGRMVGDWRKAPRHLLVGFLGFAANWPLILVMIYLVSLSGLENVLPPPSHPVQDELAGGMLIVLGVFFVAVIMAPLIEEFTFRGVLFSGLTAAWGKIILAGVVSSLFFAAVHPQGPLGWPMLATVGGMAALLYYRTGSILPAIFMHAFHNAFVLSIGLGVAI